MEIIEINRIFLGKTETGWKQLTHHPAQDLDKINSVVVFDGTASCHAIMYIFGNYAYLEVTDELYNDAGMTELLTDLKSGIPDYGQLIIMPS